MFFGVGAVGRQSIVGKRGVQGASLDLGFMSPGVLDPRITFTRASTATYFDATGTMQSAAINAPRWDYNPTTRALNGLLIEESRQNIVLQSQFGGASWTAAGSVLTANAVASPDGTADAATIREDGTTGIHYTTQSITKAASAIQYAFTCFFKQGAGTRNIKFEIDDAGSNGLYFVLNPSTGAVVTDATLIGTGWTLSPVVVTALPNGWWRVTCIMTSSTVTAIRFLFLMCTGTVQSYAGDNTSNVQIYGCQLEAGAFPTSYIPTTTVAVTRAQEVMSMPTGAWFNAAAGTLSLEVRYNGSTVASFPVLASLDDGSNNNLVLMLGKLTGLLHCEGTASGVNQWGIPGPFGPDPGVIRKPGVSMALNNINYDINGVAGTPDTVATLPAVTQLHLGCNQLGATGAHSVAFRRVRYWPRALTAAELQSVTT